MNVFALIISFTFSTLASTGNYTIQKNDSLSCLAETKVGKPVFGGGGSLSLLIDMNKKSLSDGTILTGDQLKFPSKELTAYYTPVTKDNVSPECLRSLAKEGASEKSHKNKRRLSGLDSKYACGCKEVCPHMHDNSDHVVSNDNKKSVEKSPKVTERYIKEVGIYQSSLEASSRVDSTSAEFVSRENFFLKGGYQILRNNWWYGFIVEYHLPNFEDVESVVYTWDGDLPNLLKFSLTADRDYNRLGLGFSLDYNQELFFTEELFEVSLEEVFILGATFKLEYSFVKTDNYLADVGVRLSYPYIGSANMDPRGEFSYLAYLNLTKSSFLNRFEMTLSAFYGEKNFITDTFDQQEQIVGLSLSLRDKVSL